MNSFKCFLVQLTPFLPEYRNKLDLVKPFQKMSIDKGLCGMGWRGADEFNGVSGNISDFKNNINRRTGLGKAFNEYRIINIGDYVITRLKFSSDCYIGKVTKEAYINEDVTEYSWTVDCNWKHIGQHSQLPSAIRGLMGKQLPTIELIPKKYDIANNLISDLYEGYINRYTLTEANFHTALAPYDLEDLVQMYMEKENEGFRLYSSTCKPSEPEIEFILTDGNEQITCQVKNEKAIDVNPYKVLAKNFKKIYLFSGQGIYSNDINTPENVIKIPREQLFNLLKEDFAKSGHFFKLINEHYILKN